MPRISDQRRSQRKQQVYELIRSHAEGGIRTAEIADTLNFAERTVRDYLREIEEEYLITKENRLWFPVDNRRPVKLEIPPEQLVVLYIALRMFVKQSDRRNHLAENLLLKIAQLAHTELSLGDDLQQAAQELAHRPQDDDYEDIFVQVVRAYLFNLRLHIRYHPYRSEPFETIVEPYLIEPSSFGYGSYLIGHSSAPNAYRTYKLERILSAELTTETFVVPSEFPGLEILRNAWSIMYGNDPVRVVLRFAPEVKRRVMESNWRGDNPIVEDDPDLPGYLIYAFDISDTTDLKPWIRTWGANVEVLEPAYLRDEMIGEARALAQRYGWQTTRSQDDGHARFGDLFGG